SGGGELLHLIDFQKTMRDGTINKLEEQFRRGMKRDLLKDLWSCPCFALRLRTVSS
ncbi:hypothetical protein PROFUN_14489, partial [Planoprotostelium fungivorum]